MPKTIVRSGTRRIPPPSPRTAPTTPAPNEVATSAARNATWPISPLRRRSARADQGTLHRVVQTLPDDGVLPGRPLPDMEPHASVDQLRGGTNGTVGSTERARSRAPGTSRLRGVRIERSATTDGVAAVVRPTPEGVRDAFMVA